MGNPAPAGGGQARLPRYLTAAGVLAALAAIALWLDGHPDHGRQAALTLAFGAAFGIILQRARFCFFCHLREGLEDYDARGLLAILAALATGTVGYALVMGSWVPDPAAGYLAPRAHIGPASWVVMLGGATFGLGMSLSGSCISSHLYRLGEGSLLAPLALAGCVVGFMLGFHAWNALWPGTLASAPPVWLPASLGYTGATALQLVVLAALALLLLRRVPPRPARSGEPPGAAGVWQAVVIHRWPAWTGGVAVGILGTAAYLRTSPLGVTSEINRIARNLGRAGGLTPDRLEGLDRVAGCIAAETAALISDNGMFLLALVAASFACALAAGQFRPRLPGLRPAIGALTGGVLLGFGAMIALGCTIGTLLSGISAMALSGWMFAAAMVAGVWVGLPLRRHLVMR